MPSTLMMPLKIALEDYALSDSQQVDDDAANAIIKELSYFTSPLTAKLSHFAQTLVWIANGSPRTLGVIACTSSIAGVLVAELGHRVFAIGRTKANRTAIAASLIPWLPFLFDQARARMGRIIPNNPIGSARDYVAALRHIYVGGCLSGSPTNESYSRHVFINCRFTFDRPRSAHFDRVVFEYSTWNGGWITSSDLSSALLYRSEITNAVFVDCNLQGVSLRRCQLRDVHFIDCDLRGAQFRSSELDRVAFSGCTLEDARFCWSGLSNLYFGRCTADSESPLSAIAGREDPGLITRLLATPEFRKSVTRLLLERADEAAPHTAPSSPLPSYWTDLRWAVRHEIVLNLPRLVREARAQDYSLLGFVSELLPLVVARDKSRDTAAKSGYFRDTPDAFPSDVASTRGSEIHVGPYSQADVLRFCKYTGARASKGWSISPSRGGHIASLPPTATLLREHLPLAPGVVAFVLPKLVLRAPYRQVAIVASEFVLDCMAAHEAVHLKFNAHDLVERLDFEAWYKGDRADEAVVDNLAMIAATNYLCSSARPEPKRESLEYLVGRQSFAVALLMIYGLYMEFTCLQRGHAAGTLDPVLAIQAEHLASQFRNEFSQEEAEFWLARWSLANGSNWNGRDRAVTYFQTLTLMAIFHRNSQGGISLGMRRHAAYLKNQLSSGGLLSPAVQ